LGDLDRGRLAGVDRWLEASLQPASAFMAADTEPRRDALPPVAEAGAEDAVAENDVPQSVSVDSQSRGSMWPFAIALGIGLWLCGTAVIIVAWLVRWLAIRRLIAAAAPIGDTMTGSFPVPMLESETTIEPGIVGVVRPVLLLPKGISDRLTPQQLRAVLAHEHVHLERRDNLTASLHMIVEAIF
jgi:Zn-dependent protease with chaperone function